ncbi:MAG: peptide deformylase, partial [Bacillota bacterium]|nr:peptide deformylase [Bacillota bacterium]
MALRNIREIGDNVLRKKSKKVDVINDRIVTLINDMFETMYEAEGVGLAAPQVGILKRIVVIDTGDNPIALINPKITFTEGKIIDSEGCLSIPGEQGNVERPAKVTVKALNEKGEQIEITGEDLLARAIC